MYKINLTSLSRLLSMLHQSSPVGSMALPSGDHITNTFLSINHRQFNKWADYGYGYIIKYCKPFKERANIFCLRFVHKNVFMS